MARAWAAAQGGMGAPPAQRRGQGLFSCGVGPGQAGRGAANATARCAAAGKPVLRRGTAAEQSRLEPIDLAAARRDGRVVRKRGFRLSSAPVRSGETLPVTAGEAVAPNENPAHGSLRRGRDELPKWACLLNPGFRAAQGCQPAAGVPGHEKASLQGGHSAPTPAATPSGTRHCGVRWEGKR
ncbi:hypothetical protein GCM10027162_44560 [Streptomyces incanus]